MLLAAKLARWGDRLLTLAAALLLGALALFGAWSLWDIAAMRRAALPEQTLEIFPNSRPTGLKHGTVTVCVNSRSVEVTTFRSDGAYSDHRHPTAVSFVGDLTTDLSRRDFTMNAIALPPDGLVADPSAASTI